METKASNIVMDTHIHSKASDGAWRPSEVVKQAKSRGLKVIALTDHDSIFGVHEALEEASKQGIKVIKGTEIDAEYSYENIKVKDVELLGLGTNLCKIGPFIKGLNDARMAALDGYVREFNKYIIKQDFSETNDDLANFRLSNPTAIKTEEIIQWRNEIDLYHNPTPFLSKRHAVLYIYHRFGTSWAVNELENNRDAYGILRKKYSSLWTGAQRKTTFYCAIEEIKKAEGIAVIAHPGIPDGYKDGMIEEWKYPQPEWFKEGHGFTPFMFIKDLKRHGLDGVELYNYYGTGKVQSLAEQEKINHYFQKVADKLGLLTTYGSDCHGPKGGKDALMGTFGSEKIYHLFP